MYTLLIPKEKSKREKKTGGGPFWKSYWEQEVQRDPIYYASQYKGRVSTVGHALAALNKHKYTKKDRRYYAEIALDYRASSKSKEPNKLWVEAGLAVVETRDHDGHAFMTVSGVPEDFKKLEKIARTASFTDALKGGGNAQDLSRQIFAVTSIYDKNNTIENRVSPSLYDLIKENYPDSLDCIIVIRYERRLSEYEKIFNEILQKVPKVNLRKRDKEFFVSNMSYRAILTVEQIVSLLSDPAYGYIARIKVSPEFIVQRTTPSINLNVINVGPPLTDEKVVIIDSGIDNQLINPFVTYRKNYLTGSDVPDKNHGTNVASRLMFGHNLFHQISKGQDLNPVGKVVDIQVLHRVGSGDVIVDPDVLLKAIKESTNRLDATLYNLSIADKKPVDERDDVDDSTALIDSISSKKDILFINAVGNQTGNFALGYESIFNVPDSTCNISAPSDAINSLSVGSIAETADVDAICSEINHPSPFTRKGGMRNDMKKPELVDYGGNVRKDPTNTYGPAHLEASANKYGVDVMDSVGFCRDVGTSLSAPVVTRMAVMVLDYLKKSSLSQSLPLFSVNKANLVKALLIHSTARVDQVKIKNDAVKRAFGFGRADYAAALFDQTEDAVTIVYADAINFSEKRQKILVKLPESLLNKQVELIFTLVYNPPVNVNFSEYKMVNLQGSVGFVFPEMKDGQPTGKMKVSPLSPSHSWDRYKSKNFNTIHFKKNAKVKYRDLQIGVQMTVSDHLLNEYSKEEILQNYAVVLSIKDKQGGGRLRAELLRQNQLIELVENQVKVSIKN